MSYGVCLCVYMCLFRLFVLRWCGLFRVCSDILILLAKCVVCIVCWVLKCGFCACRVWPLIFVIFGWILDFVHLDLQDSFYALQQVVCLFVFCFVL